MPQAWRSLTAVARRETRTPVQAGRGRRGCRRSRIRARPARHSGGHRPVRWAGDGPGLPAQRRSSPRSRRRRRRTSGCGDAPPCDPADQGCGGRRRCGTDSDGATCAGRWWEPSDQSATVARRWSRLRIAATGGMRRNGASSRIAVNGPGVRKSTKDGSRAAVMENAEIHRLDQPRPCGGISLPYLATAGFHRRSPESSTRVSDYGHPPT